MTPEKLVDDLLDERTIVLSSTDQTYDNGQPYYRGSDGELYVDVDGSMHVCTEEGEPLHAVNNTVISHIPHESKSLN